MDQTADPDAGQPVLAVVGARADAPPPGLPGRWPGYRIRFVATGPQLATEAVGAEIVFLWDQVDWLRRWWGWSHRLRWVAAPTAGVDWLLFPGLVDSDVVVTNAAGVFDDAMAEYTLALVSAITVDLPGTLRLQARREWRHRETGRLAGRRAVVLGAGGIGRAVAGLLSRGALADEEALRAALRAGTIAGAALDVFTAEPLAPGSLWWDTPNVIVSPHMSGDFRGWDRALTGLFLDQLRRWQAGQPLANVVDKRLGFVASG